MAGGAGGGIFAKGSLMLIDSVVSKNVTFDFGNGSIGYGGGIYSDYGDVTLSRSTVSGNGTTGASGYGGGIFSKDGVVTLLQSTISGNTTFGAFARGGGIASHGPMMLYQSTVSGNHSYYSYGGGISSDNDTVVISGSIVAGNMAGFAVPDMWPGTGALTVDYSLIGNTSDLTAGHLADINAGTGNLLDVDAMLAPLSDYGGPTQTHALLAASPAIDAGDPSLTSPPDVDQRGAPFARVVDGGVVGVRIDMGAYERQDLSPGLLVVDTTIDELDTDFGPGDLSLREATNLANGSPGTDTVTFDATVFGTSQRIVLTRGGPGAWRGG